MHIVHPFFTFVDITPKNERRINQADYLLCFINRTISLDRFVRSYIIDVKKEVAFMSITATELKTNLSKYLLLAATEDIYITRNGKTVARLTSPYQNKMDILDSLYGSLPGDITEEEARNERLDQI